MDKKFIFKELITNFHNFKLPDLIRRNLSLPEFFGNVRKAIVLIGMRRAGKTWCLYQRAKELIAKGLVKEKILYINFEDSRLFGTTINDLEFIIEAYYELYPEFIGREDIYFMFDEIHEVEGWEKFIRRLLDNEKMQIYITGSSAKMLSTEIASSLRGRSITREIFPFDFKDYLLFKNFITKNSYSSNEISILKHHAKEFLQMGGFPEVIQSEKIIRREILQSYINTVVYRDIIERYKLQNVEVLRAFITYCLQNPASLLSINKLFKRFKSLGYSIGKNSLHEFLDYFEDVYCIFKVPIFDFSVSRQSVNPKKIYPVDQSMVAAYNIRPGYELSAELEVTIFMYLRRRYEQIYYYHSKTGFEVDFVTMDNNNQMKLIQVCLEIHDENTKLREVRALEVAMQDLKLKESIIVTLDHKEIITSKESTINIIPLYEFLLDK